MSDDGDDDDRIFIPEQLHNRVWGYHYSLDTSEVQELPPYLSKERYKTGGLP
jgi:hypothetical protein